MFAPLHADYMDRASPLVGARLWVSRGFFNFLFASKSKQYYELEFVGNAPHGAPMQPFSVGITELTERICLDHKISSLPIIIEFGQVLRSAEGIISLDERRVLSRTVDRAEQLLAEYSRAGKFPMQPSRA